jgi:hypothetical protein
VGRVIVVAFILCAAAISIAGEPLLGRHPVSAKYPEKPTGWGNETVTPLAVKN